MADERLDEPEGGGIGEKLKTLVKAGNLDQAQELGKALGIPLDLSDIDLQFAKLCEVDFSNCVLSRAQLRNSRLSRANLSNTKLSDAILSKADLSSADLSSADLCGADLTGANLSEAKYDRETRWPEGFDPIAAGAILAESG